jgi:hypothetical protein
MSDKCDPIRLPIHIEPSCGSKCDCTKTDTSDCGTTCIINSVMSSQSSYQNTCDENIQQIPTIDIAYLSNVRDSCDADLSVVLNPTTLTWCDFLTLFYRANNVFSVNPTNQNSCAINFVNQTFTNTTSQHLKLNLAQQIRTAWATKCETTVDNIPPKTNILLNKETFGVRSLLNSSSSVSLTLDQAIETLLANGEIAPGDSTTSALVRFVVQYKYCFKPLNTCVVVSFVFLTSIPCYKNVNFCDDWCPPYSNDKNCRNCHDLTGETKNIMEYLNKNFKSDKDAVNDDMSDFDSESVHKNDEKTQISLDSSNW